MSTFIHGIGTAQMIDSSGEIVDIKGHDISSLDKTGTVNYEHHDNLPAQSVGKILKAKKIYKASDCSDENERKFWDKVQVPFVYIMAELFDDYCDSAKDAAGKMKYSYDRPHLHGVYGFSIQGSSIPGTKEGVTIKRSIGRKVSLTENPANKTCVAEWMPPQESQVKDDFESIFKSQDMAIASFKKGEAIGLYEEFLAKKEMDMQKSAFAGKPHVTPSGTSGVFGLRPKAPGAQVGTTSSGKGVFANQHVHDYQNFSSQDHKDAAGFHQKAAQGIKNNPKLADHHTQKMKLHNSAAMTAENRENRFNRGVQAKRDAAKAFGKMEKAITAGSGDAAPSSLVDGAAFQKENLKKEWSKRAKDEYLGWKHREKFEKFMKSQMPHLADGEIRAIGRVIALQKATDAEKALGDLFDLNKGALKFGSPEDQAKVAAALEERKKNPPKKPEPKKKSPHLTHPIDSEVSHVEPYGERHDIVHLASGHELHGHPRGKFKVGDKVHAKPHLMGTHLLEHKK